MQGIVKGSRPHFIRKTDEERIQNIKDGYLKTAMDEEYIITEKLDGSSMTVYWKNDEEYGVCSRNLDIKEDDNNKMWQLARKYKLIEGIKALSKDHGIHEGFAVQGEIFGEGIQNNPHKIKRTRL
jgi:RNA ligase (TIGR02306 family)